MLSVSHRKSLWQYHGVAINFQPQLPHERHTMTLEPLNPRDRKSLWQYHEVKIQRSELLRGVVQYRERETHNTLHF